MEVAIFNLDWRSARSLIDTQLTSVNSFMRNITIKEISTSDELLIIFYEAVSPIIQQTVLVVKMTDEFRARGKSASEQFIKNLLVGKTQVKVLHISDDGVIVIICS
jgi:hypothetical protein